jgi:heme A synthase
MDRLLANVLFLLFAATLVVFYIAIRRRLAPVTLLALGCVVLSIILMTLVSLAAGNHVLQAFAVGILVGGLFSAVTLGMAVYFATAERRYGYGRSNADAPGTVVDAPPDQPISTSTSE